MLRTLAVCMVGVLAGCKGKSAAPGGGSPGSGSAVTAVADDAAVPADASGPSPQAVLEVDTDVEDPGLLAAFDNKVPLLPAISADGKTIATLDSGATGPGMPVEPWSVAFSAVGPGGKDEHVDIVDEVMLEKADLGDSNEWKNVPAEELRKRGAAARQKLAGYTSLSRVDLEITSNGDNLPTKIGTFTLKTDEHDDALVLALVDGRGTSLHRETVKNFVDGEWDTGDGKASCEYRPTLNDVYQDAQKRHLYLMIGFRWQEMCGATDRKVVVWDLPAPSAADAAAAADLDAVTKLVAGQLDAMQKRDTAQLAAEVQLFTQKGLGTRDKPGIELTKPDLRWAGHEDRDVEVKLSRDGKSAWTTGIAGIVLTTKNANRRGYDLRVSSVMVKTQAGWRIAASALTEPVANQVVNDGAKAGTWTHATFAGAAGDASVQAAFGKLVATGLDAAAAANPDLVTIGSADGERTIGGAKLAKAWAAAWKGKAKVTSSIAGVAPSGTTGWIGATVELPKKGYKVPFYVFCVFDKTASGEWTLVHMHLAV